MSNLPSMVEDFQRRFDKPMAAAIAAMDTIRDFSLNVELQTLPYELRRLQGCVSAEHPKAIEHTRVQECYSGSHYYDTHRTQIYHDGNSFIQWINRLIPKLEEQVNAIAMIEVPSAKQQQFIEGYVALTEVLLPAWQKDNYLQNLGVALQQGINTEQNLVLQRKAQEEAKTAASAQVKVDSLLNAARQRLAGKTGGL